MSHISDSRPFLRPTGPYISERPFLPTGSSNCHQDLYITKWCPDESSIITHHKTILTATKDETLVKLAEELYLIDRVTGVFHPYFESQFLNLDPLLKDNLLEDSLFSSVVQLCALFQFSMPASLIKSNLPHIVLNADCSPQDFDRQPQIIILVKMHGVASYLKFPFHPEAALKLLARDSNKTITNYISRISKALIPPNWCCRLSESQLQKHADKIKIDFKELQSLGRILLCHSDGELAVLGFQLMSLGMCNPSSPIETTQKDNIRVIFAKLPEIIGSRKTKEERTALLNNLGSALDHSLDNDFTKGSYYATLKHLAASDHFNQQDFFWNMVMMLSNNSNEKLPAIASLLVEERLNPNIDIEKLRQYITLSSQFKSSSTSGLLRIIAKIEKCRLMTSDQQLDLLITVGQSFKNQSCSSFEHIPDLYRFFPQLYNSILQKAIPSDKPRLQTLLVWTVQKMTHIVDGMTDAIDLFEAAIQGEYITPKDTITVDLALFLCQNLQDIHKEGVIAAGTLWKKVFQRGNSPIHRQNECREFLLQLVERLYAKPSHEALCIGDEILDSFERFPNNPDNSQGIIQLRKAKIQSFSVELGKLKEKKAMERLTGMLTPMAEFSSEFSLEANVSQSPQISRRLDIGEMIKLARTAETEREKEQCRGLISYSVHQYLERSNIANLPLDVRILTSYLLREDVSEIFKSDHDSLEMLFLDILKHALIQDIKENANSIFEIFATVFQEVLSNGRPLQSPRFYAGLSKALQDLHDIQTSSRCKLPKPFYKAARKFFPALLQCLKRANMPQEMLPVLSMATTYVQPLESASALRENLLWCCEELLSSHPTCDKIQLNALQHICTQALLFNLLFFENKTDRHFHIFRRLFHGLITAHSFDLSLPWLTRLEKFSLFKQHSAETLDLLLTTSANCINERNADQIFSHIQHQSVRVWGKPDQLQKVALALVKQFLASNRYNQCAELLTSCHCIILGSPIEKECADLAQLVCGKMLTPEATASKKMTDHSSSVIKLLSMYAICDAQLWRQTLEKVMNTRDRKLKLNACMSFLTVSPSLNPSAENRSSLSKCWQLVVDMLVDLEGKEIYQVMENSCPIHRALADVSLHDLRGQIYATCIKGVLKLAISEKAPDRIPLINTLIARWETAYPTLTENRLQEWAALTLPILHLCASVDGPSFIEFQCRLIDFHVPFGTDGVANHVERLLVRGSKTKSLTLTEQECLIEIAALSREKGFKNLDHLQCAEALIRFKFLEAHQEAAMMVHAKVLTPVANTSPKSKTQKDRLRLVIDQLLAKDDTTIFATITSCLPWITSGKWFERDSLSNLYHPIIYHRLTHLELNTDLIDALEFFHEHFHRTDNMSYAGDECVQEVLKVLPQILSFRDMDDLFSKVDGKVANILKEMIDQKIASPVVYVEYFEYVKRVLEEVSQTSDLNDPIYGQLLKHMYIITKCKGLPTDNLVGLLLDFALCIRPENQIIPSAHQKNIINLLSHAVLIFRGNTDEYYALAMYCGYYVIANKRLTHDTEGKSLKNIVARLCEEGTPDHWKYALKMTQLSQIVLPPKHSNEILSCYKQLLDECQRYINPSFSFKYLFKQVIDTLPALLKHNEQLAVNICMILVARAESICKAKEPPNHVIQLRLLNYATSFIYCAFNLGVFDKNDRAYVLLIERLFLALKEIDLHNQNTNATIWIPTLLFLIRPYMKSPLIQDPERLKIIKAWAEHFKPYNSPDQAELNEKDYLQIAIISSVAIRADSQGFAEIFENLLEDNDADEVVANTESEEDEVDNDAEDQEEYEVDNDAEDQDIYDGDDEKLPPTPSANEH